MEANPALPATINGKRLRVNSSSAPGPSAPAQIASIRNAPAIYLPKWRAALAKVKSAAGGTYNCKLLCMGDSTTFGVGSNGTSTGNLKPLAWPTELASLMNNAGINAHSNSWMASGGGAAGGTSQTNDANDSRISVTGGWAKTATTLSFIGGCPYSGSTTGTINFTPTVNVDTFKVYYYQTGGGGTFSYQIDSGAATNQSTAGASAIQSVVISAGSLGSHTCTINWVNSTSINPIILGMEAYDSSKNWVDVINAGWPVSRLSDWSQGASVFYNPTQGGISGFAPDLTIIDLGINDLGAGNPIAQMLVNLKSIIAKCQLSGDVVIQSFNPCNTPVSATNYPLAEQTAWQQALASFCNSNNIPYLDIMGRMGGGSNWSANNTNGYMFDGLHPNNVGYYDKAQAIYNFIAQP